MPDDAEYPAPESDQYGQFGTPNVSFDAIVMLDIALTDH